MNFRRALKPVMIVAMDGVLFFREKFDDYILNIIRNLIRLSYKRYHYATSRTKQNNMENNITCSIFHLGGKVTALQIYSFIGKKSGERAFVEIHDHLNIMVANGRLRCEFMPSDNGDSSYRRVYSAIDPK